MGRPKTENRADIAESTLAIRVTKADRRLLDALIKLRQQELGRDAKVSQASYIRALLYEKAEAKGVALPPESEPPEPSAQPSKRRRVAR